MLNLFQHPTRHSRPAFTPVHSRHAFTLIVPAMHSGQSSVESKKSVKSVVQTTFTRCIFSTTFFDNKIIISKKLVNKYYYIYFKKSKRGSGCFVGG